MKFGTIEDLESADLTLPQDHPQTEKILAGLTKSSGSPQVFVGCAKWGRKEWLGMIYPEGTKEKDFLENYVLHFNSIELNATHYRLFKRDVISSWKEKAPDGFKFCPKFHRQITHLKWLKGMEEFSEFYFRAMNTFEDRLGVCLLQLPEKFTPKATERLFDYLDIIPKGFPVALELRHPGWFEESEESEALFKKIEELGMTVVITDTAGRRDIVHQRLTSGTAFIRFVGYDKHPTDFTRIDAWVDRIDDWIKKGIQQIYFFMHQPDETNTPEMAAYAIRELNKKCGLDIKEPNFLGN